MGVPGKPGTKMEALETVVVAGGQESQAIFQLGSPFMLNYILASSSYPTTRMSSLSAIPVPFQVENASSESRRSYN